MANKPYKRVTWLPKDANGDVPANAPAISAENLNNMENGIEEALAGVKALQVDHKTYADNNILYFSGVAQFVTNTWVDLFQLPTSINFAKYIPVVQVGAVRNYKHLFVLPYNTVTQVFYENWKDIQIEITSNGLIKYNSPQSSGTVEMHIILLPVGRQEMIANP